MRRSPKGFVGKIVLNVGQLTDRQRRRRLDHPRSVRREPSFGQCTSRAESEALPVRKAEVLEYRSVGNRQDLAAKCYLQTPDLNPQIWAWRSFESALASFWRNSGWNDLCYQSTGLLNAAAQSDGPLSGVTVFAVSDCANQLSARANSNGAGRSASVTEAKPTRL